MDNSVESCEIVNGQIKRIPHLDGHHLSLGLAAPSFNYKSFALGEESCSFGYHSSGDIYLSGQKVSLSNTPGSMSYNSSDIVGCGIIYPPLSKSKHGSIFFTINGHLIHIFDLDVCEYVLSAPFFPIVVRY